MNKKNLEILGLREGATEEEIKNAYQAARAFYEEERFQDGEKGNEAARMLTKLDVAYQELLTEFAEQEESKTESLGSAFAKVEELIRNDDLTEAQHALDAFNERTAYWHYLQSVVFYKKNWTNESKKQLEIALQLDPANEKYKESLRKMTEKMRTESTGEGAKRQQNQSAYTAQNMDEAPSDQMGGQMCASCLEWCYCTMCINCLCNGCMH